MSDKYDEIGGFEFTFSTESLPVFRETNGENSWAMLAPATEAVYRAWLEQQQALTAAEARAADLEKRLENMVSLVDFEKVEARRDEARSDWVALVDENAITEKERNELRRERDSEKEKLRTLKGEIIACLEMHNGIRVREGGGFENLAASLAVTMAKMAKRAEAAESESERDQERARAERLAGALRELNDWMRISPGEFLEKYKHQQVGAIYRRVDAALQDAPATVEKP